jgi:restriction system protein
MGGMSGKAEIFQDLITEEVGCKSGLLLTDNEAHQLLLRKEHDEAALFDTDRDQMVRFRPEEIEDIILNLRHQIGNLPDPRYGAYDRIAWMKKLHFQGIDVGPIYDAFGKIVESGKYKVIGEEAAAEMVQLSGMSELLVAQFLMHVATQMDRSMYWFKAESIDVEWAIPLRAVFESETIPDDPDQYLDQRYIDYFVHNGEDLQELHWRNFERLTTEFFRRHGYEVLLGPGGNDGGVDVRVWPAGVDRTGPPLLLIQCKRQADGRDVSAVTVKALWSDVSFEGAKHGLIATTSRIAPSKCRERGSGPSVSLNISRSATGRGRCGVTPQSSSRTPEGVGKVTFKPLPERPTSAADSKRRLYQFLVKLITPAASQSRCTSAQTGTSYST